MLEGSYCPLGLRAYGLRVVCDPWAGDFTHLIPDSLWDALAEIYRRS